MKLNSIDCEIGVLASILWDSRNECMDKAGCLSIDHFSIRSHKLIFEACLSLYNEGKPVDQITLNDRLRALGKLDELGGDFGFKSIMGFIPTSAHIDHYIDQVTERYKLLRLNELAVKIQRESESCIDVKELVSNIESDIYSLQQDRTQENQLQKASEALDYQIKIRKEGKKVFGLPSGIQSFDKYFGGFQKGQYYILAGRPSAGKSAMADQIVCNLITKDIPVLYIALEAAVDRVYAKIVHKQAGLVYTDFCRGGMIDSDLDKLDAKNKIIARSKLQLLRPDTVSPKEIRSIIRRNFRQHKIELVVFDYLQKCQIPSGYDERRAVTEASDQVQKACVDTGVPALVLVQLNRESDKAARPTMSMIKESGSVEQDADNVMLLFPEVDPYSVPSDKPLPVIMAIEKNKDGMRGVDVELNFDRPKMKFEERKYFI